MLFQFLPQSSLVERLLNACIAALPHLPAHEKAVLETAIRCFEADEDAFVCAHCGAHGDIENSVETSVGLVCDACADGQAVYAAIADWKWQVAEDNTKLGFADWMSHERQASAETSTAESATAPFVAVAAEAINGAEPQDVVYSRREAQDNEGAGFWSNQDGWTTFADATRFTASEREALNRPLASGNDAIWLKLNHGGSSDESSPAITAASLREAGVQSYCQQVCNTLQCGSGPVCPIGIDVNTEMPPEMHEVFQGYLTSDGLYIGVEFQAPAGASETELDAAFLAALAQEAQVDYVVVGTRPA